MNQDSLTEKERISASIAIVSDEHMRELNAKHRGKDYATDVLSFTLNEPTPEGVFLMGEVVVNRDAAARQATELGHSVEEEIAFLVAHGVMHLQGIHHEHDE